MATTKTKNYIGRVKKSADTVTKRLSKAGKFLQTWPKGEIHDMRAVMR